MIGGWLPMGPFPPHRNDPFGWIMVTNEGTYPLGPRDIRESGAKFTRTGRPANLEAALLYDFCELDLFDLCGSREAP